MACSYDPYRLGMWEWTDCPRRALLNAPRPAVPPISTEQPHLQCPNCVQTLQNSLKKRSFQSSLKAWFQRMQTIKSTKWDLNNFEALMKARNMSYPDDQVPQDILLCSDPELLNLHLSRFVIETNCCILYAY